MDGSIHVSVEATQSLKERYTGRLEIFLVWERECGTTQLYRLVSEMFTGRGEITVSCRSIYRNEEETDWYDGMCADGCTFPCDGGEPESSS